LRIAVTELIFALEFRGRAGAVPGVEGKRRSRSVAPSQALSSVLGAGGVHSRVDRLGGEEAVLEAEVEVLGEGVFTETGTIRYGSAGSVTFATLGQGVVVPSDVPGARRGAVMWRVTGGDGRFAGAHGIITSNFAVSPEGDVVDNHVARIYVRD
jgi:hypothetical protein